MSLFGLFGGGHSRHDVFIDIHDIHGKSHRRRVPKNDEQLFIKEQDVFKVSDNFTQLTSIHWIEVSAD